VRIDIISVGRLKAGPEVDLYTRYAERFSALSRGLGLSGLRLVELPESQARRDADRRAEEGRALLASLEKGAFVLALDERGQTQSSLQFSERMARSRDAGKKAFQFVVGGPDGLDVALRQRADYVLSVGAMTMPHQLLRIVLAEQIYRAATILADHPYHRV
jgi:23S rRNA (pseudouridine1915-N3)-methyltransferase